MATANLASETSVASFAPQSAESVVLDELDQYLAETENALSIPYSALNQAISDVVDQNGKAIRRITERILREADKHAVATDNALEAITTGLLGGIDSWLGDTEYLLRDLASRGGLIGPGDPLTQALIKEVTRSPEMEFSATLLLAARDGLSQLKRIADALDKIVGRMSPLEDADVDPPAGEAAELDVTTDENEKLVGYWKYV